MVQPLGHLAVGLIFAVPAWIIWDGRTSAAFIGLVLLTSRLPDVDLLLQGFGLPIKHHGVTHTIVFVLGFSIVVGLVLTLLLKSLFKRWWRMSEGETVNQTTIYVFVTGALLLGGLSHLLADGLAADWAEPIEPFWPFFEASYEVGVIYYDSIWANLGLFVLAIALHLPFFASELFPLDTRVRGWTVDLPGMENS